MTSFAQQGPTPIRNTERLSTGEKFARAFMKSGLSTEVNYDFTITEEFKPGINRPRIPMISWVMKRRLVNKDSIYCWSERRLAAGQEAKIKGTNHWKEFKVGFEAHEVKIRPIQAWIQVPDLILDDPECLADFIDYRLLPRLGTVENEQITIGPAGILRHPDLTQVPYSGSFVEGLLNLCLEVEQNGATAHVIVLNTFDYYTSLVGQGQLLQNLMINGNILVRTRMIDRGCALVGDFAVATRFFHKGMSQIRFGEPPPDTFAKKSTCICAETYVGASLSLPTHVYHMSAS